MNCPKTTKIDGVTLTLLLKFRKKDFLHKIIKGDEKWILYDDPKRRKSWADSGQPSILISKYIIQEGFTLYLVGLEWCVVLRVITTKLQQSWQTAANNN